MMASQYCAKKPRRKFHGCLVGSQIVSPSTEISKGIGTARHGEIAHKTKRN